MPSPCSSRRNTPLRKRARLLALSLLAALFVSACEVSVGDDEGDTVTQAAPTVTEREVIKRRTVESQEPTGTTAPEVPDDVGGNVQEAIATVESEGYQVFNPDSYDPSYPLRVLIGIKKDSATGYAQRAFFFYGDEYLGNDTSADSATIEYEGQDDNTISLSYKLYRSDDPNCCPTAGEATVRYDWNGSELTPLDEIPTEDFDADRSRR